MRLVSSTKDIPTLDEILLATGIGEEEFDSILNYWP
jgi:endonuclease III-like uncharacterized protein